MCAARANLLMESVFPVVAAALDLPISCQDVLDRNASSATGDYWINIGGEAVQAHCDMDEDGGGWTLVGNYLHMGSIAGYAHPRPHTMFGLPLMGDSQVGVVDESTSTDVSGTWGHAAPALLAQVRLQCCRHCLHIDCAAKGHCWCDAA